MKQLRKPFILGLLLVLICLAPLHAQTSTQAPDDATKKISDLVHAGKYADAQQLTNGLLIAYPNDQRLIKAKGIIDEILAPAEATASPASSAPTAQPASTADQLTGMDKVDYNTLIVLARQAQQATDRDEQKKSMQRFMDQSGTFLQKHPEQMLIWELRAQSALILNDPMAGYEAGQKLLSAGAADSSDPALQQLLGQLNGKGWLDKQKAEDDKKYGDILGIWKISWSVGTAPNQNGSGEKEEFVKSNSGDIEGRFISGAGEKQTKPNMRGIINASGNISWEMYLRTISEKNGNGMDPEDPGGQYFTVGDVPGKQLYPSGWQPPIFYFLSEDKRTITMKFPQQTPNLRRDSGFVAEHPVTWTFEKVGD